MKLIEFLSQYHQATPQGGIHRTFQPTDAFMDKLIAEVLKNIASSFGKGFYYSVSTSKDLILWRRISDEFIVADLLSVETIRNAVGPILFIELRLAIPEEGPPENFMQYLSEN